MRLLNSELLLLVSSSFVSIPLYSLFCPSSSQTTFAPGERDRAIVFWLLSLFLFYIFDNFKRTKP